MNEQKLCEQRDDYLLDELPVEQRAEFEQHLDSCESCRVFLETQARIDRILQEATNLVAVSAELSPRIVTNLVAVRRRRKTLIAALILTPIAAGLFALFYFATRPTDEPGRPEQIVRNSEQQPVPEVIVDHKLTKPESAPVEVEVSGDVIAMEIDSGDPDVTIIQVFPVNHFEHGKRK